MYQTTMMRDVKPYQITKNQFLLFLMLFLYAQTAFKRILKVNAVWRVGNISFDKLINLIQLPEENREGETLNQKEVKGDITVNNISFSYPNNKAIFNGYSASFSAHSIHIIKGKVGAGKSTLFKLIQKIYEPQTGELCIDKTPFADYSPFALRKLITIVSTETPLIGNNVFKAVSYSTKPEKEEKAIAMLQKLKLQFSEDEQENLHFKIEDGGKNLSSGQRILLQFARAFLTKKLIILLDEPFHYLDQESIETIVRELNVLKKKKTIIIASSIVPDQLEVDNIVYI
jgi:ABC-type bacteriocin/lantibiotic exporter with double-glycine peptidase domain